MSTLLKSLWSWSKRQFVRSKQQFSVCVFPGKSKQRGSEQPDVMSLWHKDNFGVLQMFVFLFATCHFSFSFRKALIRQTSGIKTLCGCYRLGISLKTYRPTVYLLKHRGWTLNTMTFTSDLTVLKVIQTSQSWPALTVCCWDFYVKVARVLLNKTDWGYRA